MRFVKMPAILPSVANLSCIRKRIFDVTGSWKNIKKHFFDNALIFSCSFFYNFMKLPQWLV